ncbi:ATP-dependent DNA helicase [Aliikangiella sp. IMCC44632]
MKVKLSVNELVNFSARTGDLFSEASFGPSALEGIRGHQLLQSQRGANWQQEVTLKYRFKHETTSVDLKGRLDLLKITPNGAIIEEIKTTYLEHEQIPLAKKQLHLAQAKVYGCLYYLSLTDQQQSELALDNYTIRTSWFNLTTNSNHYEDVYCSGSELLSFTQSLIATYCDWYLAHQKQIKLLKTSANQLQFPFEHYREDQHLFARNVYLSIKNKSQLLVSAPTGSGKTIATIFPALKAIGTGLAEQVVYLTAKQLTGQAAESLLKKLSAQLDIMYLTLQAKDKLCPCRSPDRDEQLDCIQEDGRCNRTIGFFDRLPQARITALNKKQLDAKTIREIADNYQLCPFELSLQLIPWFPFVICDYNYVFDPMVKLATFESSSGKRVFLIDEIHNLLERSRDMYSASLDTNRLNYFRKKLIKHKQLVLCISKLANAISQACQNGSQPASPPKNISQSLEALLEAVAMSQVNSGFGAQVTQQEYAGITDWLKQLYCYYTITQLYSGSHRIITNQFVSQDKPQTQAQPNGNSLPRQPEANSEIELRCLDASEFLNKRLKLAASSIGFSATLHPLDFYKQLLGFNPATTTARVTTSFPQSNQLTLHCNFVDTRWNQRENSKSRLCELLANIIQQKSGKYLIFFPSYTYMLDVYQSFTQLFPKANCILQNKASDTAQRKAFLDHFFNQTEAVLGFAILGGIFAEGIDYHGDKLDGAIIIGTGMPSPSLQNQLMQTHFDNLGYNGFQYTFQFPGFTRVLQTAGRVIRSERDRGVVILVDPRFARADYQALMPPHWQLKQCDNIERLVEQLKLFWNT